MKRPIFLSIILISIITSCKKDAVPIDYPVIYPEILVSDDFVFQKYPDLEGFYILQSQEDVDRLEENSENDIMLDENIHDFDFENKIILGAIGKPELDHSKIIFSPVLEKENIEVHYYEVKNAIHQTSEPVQNYLFVSIDRTNKDIVFIPE